MMNDTTITAPVLTTMDSASDSNSALESSDCFSPKQRKGMLGFVDSVVGPGITLGESLTPFLTASVAISFLWFLVIPRHPEWSLGQCLWATFFSLNAGFGVAVSTKTLKRWYHKPGKGIVGLDLAFVFADGVGQMLITNYIFLDDLEGEWQFVAQLGSFLFLSFALCSYVPPDLKRPTNTALLMTLIFLATNVFPQISGLEWYPYVLFVKYLSHISP
jgi:hypothetical protein